jgi:SAM-dependent methyltransferase
MSDALMALAEHYPAWWVELLGEHNHAGGLDSTRWLLERSGLDAGMRMLDAGAFVGAAARMAAGAGIAATATDLNPEFLATGATMANGGSVHWVAADSRRLPFGDAAFDSAWALETAFFPRELSRVVRTGGTICLCCETPEDGRGGTEAFIDEWAEYGWRLAAHRTVTLEALQAWRTAEAQLVARRPHFESRMGLRGYLAQLDHVASLVRSYERRETGHGLFVLRRSHA